MTFSCLLITISSIRADIRRFPPVMLSLSGYSIPPTTTEIADALPYVFTTATTGFTGTNGYGKGVVAYYFNAASAPAWGLNYIIKISGNPAEFSSPPGVNYEISTASLRFRQQCRYGFSE